MSESDLGFGRVVDRVTTEALREWWRTYYRHEEFVDAVGMHLEQCEVIAKVKPGGRLEVMVQLSDRNPANNHALFSRWVRVSRGRYSRQQQTLDLK